MKNKYRLNWGLAFSEKKDIKMLGKLAAKGWIFNGFTLGGAFYKFTSGPKQQLTYTMDLQPKPDKEYFEIIKASGWQHITSLQNHFHFFAAPKGTKPIYSGNEIEEGKYHDVTQLMGKSAVICLLACVLFYVLMIYSKTYFASIYYPIKILMYLCLIGLVFSLMPYLAYKFKEKINR